MQSRERMQVPPAPEQLAFAVTGAFAGSCALCIETVGQSKPSAFLRAQAAPLLYRPAIRFWVFDVSRSLIRQSQAPLPVWTVGGLSGAAGGLAEVLAQSSLRRQRPRFRDLALHSSKLFLCFGTYTFLATSYSETLPPRPFWKCWLMGAAAGAFGSGIIASIEGTRGAALWRNAIPKGALTIGTVISVQVTSCAELMHFMDT